ncbi:MAG TPA: hemolysin family protein, partial [Fimbriimonadaceae bacterium]|nr:hemolysin family protein [Fimbriimonadaceae bacterium]
HPIDTSLRVYNSVRFFNAMFGTPIAVFVTLGGLVTRRFGAKATFALNNQAEEEVLELLEEAEESGEIEEEEREMVASVFEFGDTVVREVMTPRVDLEAVPMDATLQDVARLVEISGHSRIPVYEGTDDTILGIVHAKDVLSALMDGSADRPLRDLLRPTIFVPESKPLHDLLQEMRQAKTQMAVVQDEHSGTAGVVTIEDIVEEVMGEIVDEYDEDLPTIVTLDEGFDSDGRMELDDVNEVVGTSFESQEFDTIGGFVFGLFGRQPKEGESVERDGLRFTITETDGKRIQRLFIDRLPESAVPEESTAN